MTLGIDPTTGQLRSLLARGTGPTGAPADVLTEYDDYRAAGGITVAHARTVDHRRHDRAEGDREERAGESAARRPTPSGPRSSAFRDAANAENAGEAAPARRYRAGVW